MGLLDWVTLGRIDNNGANAGEFHLTQGTSWDATWGSSYEHVLGSSMNLTIDPVELLLTKLYVGGQSIVGNAVSGMSGSSDFVYGSFTRAIYGGPHFEIQRARDLEKKSDWFLRPYKLADTVKPPDPLEPTTTSAILALSLLINVVPAAMELALFCHYKDYYEPVKGKPIQKPPELLKFMAYAITTRLMAMVRTLEVATAHGQIGKKLVGELREHVASLSKALSFIIKRFKSNKQEAEGAEWLADSALIEMAEVSSALNGGKDR